MKNDKYISPEEYEVLWEDCKTKMRFTSPDISPEMKYMTVVGQSGEGTEFKNEYERMLYNHNNPPMPRSISRYGEDGLCNIYPERKK
jgi:hypothetical protein